MKKRDTKILGKSQIFSMTLLQCKMPHNGEGCHTREKSVSLWDCNHIWTETKNTTFLHLVKFHMNQR